MSENTIENGQTDLDTVLERISPEHREAFLRSRLRLRKFEEHDELLAIATHLDSFAVVIGDLSSNVVARPEPSKEVESTRKELSELAEAVKALQPQDKAHLADLTQAFEKMADTQRLALEKADAYNEKVLRKLTLLISNQPDQKLKRWVLWAAGGTLASIMTIMFLLGMKFEDGRVYQANDLVRKAVTLATDKIDSITKKGTSNSLLVKPLPTP